MNIKNIIDELIKAAEAYYQDDKELMTDDEYDTKLEYLEDLVKKGEVEMTPDLDKLLTKVAGGSEVKGNVVTHDFPMLSLGKAKDYDQLKSYHTKTIKNGATGYTIEVKLDGLALSNKFENGKLMQLSTRGDGVKGELLNYLIDNDNVTIIGLPSKLNGLKDIEVRGELYISDSQFKVINEKRKELTGEEFANPRNAVVGIIKSANKGLTYKAEITFTAYSVFKDGNQLSLDILNNEDFSRVDQVTKEQIAGSELLNNTTTNLTYEELEKMIKAFGEARKIFTIPTDGAVIKPINEIEMLNTMGFTNKHPNAFVAFKYPGEKAVTVVEDIIVTIGKTGKLTPQAKVAPIDVNGTIIRSVSCHNYAWLRDMDIRIGSTVTVTRANDVIPAINGVIDKGPNNPVEVPKNCPECGSVLTGNLLDPRTLTCESEDCPSRLLFYIKSIVGRNFLYIEGLGDVAISSLVENETITGIVDLFKLTQESLQETPTGFTSTGNVKKLGAGNAKNIMKSIENAKNNTDSNKLLASLNIDRVGPGTAKRLIAHFGGIKEVLTVDTNRLTEVEQTGQSVVDAFNQSGTRALSELEELIELGVKINDPVKVDKKDIVGSFSVSGSVEGFTNRNEFVKHMESLGWEFHKSPKKTTDVFFANPNETSSKIEKAKKDGIRIISKLEDL